MSFILEIQLEKCIFLSKYDQFFSENYASIFNRY